MVDYLHAGLKMDKPRDELLEELAKKYQRSTRQIERYIAELQLCTLDERCEETPHRQKIRELAKALARETKIPPFWDKDLWRDLPIEFRRGKYSLPIGEIEIGRDRQIKVTYSDIGSGIAEPHFLKGLFNHLRFSGSRRFAELVDEGGQLHSLAIEIEQYSQALLVFCRLLLDDVKGYKVKVNFHDEAKSGLTRWFIITAWYCVLWRAFGYVVIDDSLYKPHESIQGSNLWQLRFGAYVIGIARSEKTLETFKSWHKELRVRYAKHPLAKGVASKYHRLSETVQDIAQRLIEFSDMQNLPGHCQLCQPSVKLDVDRAQDKTKQKRSKRSRQRRI
jgi:hypothetical protein